jgi:hypothetical protein
VRRRPPRATYRNADHRIECDRDTRAAGDRDAYTVTQLADAARHGEPDGYAVAECYYGAFADSHPVADCHAGNGGVRGAGRLLE